MVLANHQVYRVLVDDENTSNILFRDVIPRMGIDFSKLTLVKTFFIRIEG